VQEQRPVAALDRLELLGCEARAHEPSSLQIDG
jgi:hypothetical protein